MGKRSKSIFPIAQGEGSKDEQIHHQTGIALLGAIPRIPSSAKAVVLTNGGIVDKSYELVFRSRRTIWRRSDHFRDYLRRSDSFLLSLSRVDGQLEAKRETAHIPNSRSRIVLHFILSYGDRQWGKAICVKRLFVN